MTHVQVTTSWDDGHKADLKLAKLLQKYELAATFYVSPEDHEFAVTDRLTDADIRTLADSCEIGAHTMTHPRLPQVSPEQAAAEITESKRYLEALTGQSVTSFCYPGGEYRPSDVTAVKAAGFTYARTVKRFATTSPTDVWLAPTTIHAYRHWSDLLPIMRLAGRRPWLGLRWLLNWDELAIALFERTRATGGTFHIWGHSWEIDRNSDWQRLERVFAHISGQPDVSYITNRELA